MCGVSLGFVREWCQLQCLHELWGELRIGGGEYCLERLWLCTGLLGGCRWWGSLHRVSYWDVQGLWQCCEVLFVPRRKPSLGSGEYRVGGLRRSYFFNHILGEGADESSRVRG